MNLERRSTRIIAFFLDELLPPILRDQYWLMWPLQWFLFGDRTRHFMEFKENAQYLDPNGIREIYEQTSHVHLQRETDLNPACLKAVQVAVKGERILEVGCGRGHLLKKLAQNFEVTGIDFILAPEIKRSNEKITLIRADIEKLPFSADSFDTVICTHTLEHVINLPAVMTQLRKIARQRLIVVVPLQRPYKYTFDLHLHFFPYPHSFLIQVGNAVGKICTRELGGDLLYIEDFQDPS
jgi:ubiquinone/menaquinone biosynthesis C-methylase UbiE